MGEGSPGTLHLGDERDLLPVERRFVGVARLVVRGEIPFGELFAQAQHAGEGVVRVLGESRPLRQLVDA